MENNKYKILCPKCKSTHDLSEVFLMWRDELMEKITKLIAEEYGVKDKNAKKIQP